MVGLAARPEAGEGRRACNGELRVARRGDHGPGVQGRSRQDQVIAEPAPQHMGGTASKLLLLPPSSTARVHRRPSARLHICADDWVARHPRVYLTPHIAGVTEMSCELGCELGRELGRSLRHSRRDPECLCLPSSPPLSMLRWWLLPASPAVTSLPSCCLRCHLKHSSTAPASRLQIATWPR